jgi:AcrR family transcriptional regulator
VATARRRQKSSSDDLGYLEVAQRRGWIHPATQARSRQMCERILSAAYEVFSEKGYQETKISDVTRRAGCSVGIFYKRFPDKAGLFYALQYRHFEATRARIDRLAEADAAETTEEILRTFVRDRVRYMIAQAGFNKAQIELSLKDERVAKERIKNFRHAGARLMQILVDRGELPDTPELRDKLTMAVRVVMATITHFVLFGPGPHPLRDERVVDNLTEILVGFLHEEQARLRSG